MRTITRTALCLSIALHSVGCDDETHEQERITQFHRAAGRGDANEVRRVLASRFDPNIQEKASGMTALHWAASAGQLDVMRLLIDAGADPNISARTPEITPLGMAIAYDQQASMLFLLEHGADPYSNVWQGKNAFENIEALSKSELMQALQEWKGEQDKPLSSTKN